MPDIAAYTMDGRPLTAEDVARLKTEAAKRRRESIEVTVPTYTIEGVFTRDELIDLFRRDWPTAGLDDVNEFIHHRRLSPVSTIPFPPAPEPPKNMPALQRHATMTDYKERRHASRKFREQFSITSEKVFVPSWAFPSANDNNETINACKERIANVNRG